MPLGPSGLIPRELSVVGALARTAQGDGPVELAALVRETVAAEVGRQALIFDPASLKPARRRPPQLRLLREAFDPLRRSARVRLFELPHGEIVAVAPLPAPQLDGVRARLTVLLEDEAADALSELRLPEEAAALLAAVERSLDLTPKAKARPGPRAPALPALDGARLADIERTLAAAHIETFLRCEWVCRLEADEVAVPLWEERRVVPESLGEMLLGGRDPAGAPWLRARLRRTLDRRMLAEAMRADEMRRMRALALPLAIDSITSTEFLRFDSMLPVALRGAVTLLFEAQDILGNPASASLARDFCRLRGFRFGIETTAANIAFLFPAGRAGHDVLRLGWSNALPDLGSDATGRLRAGLEAGPAQIVLAGVDRPSAIAWGWEMGITLFQGRLVEQRRPSV